MNKKNLGSLMVTLLCAMLILSVGYAGIVKGGRMLLNNEEKPQKAEFEDISSNIFYGKIEDDIQLFPWNYYGQNEVTGNIEDIMGEVKEQNLADFEVLLQGMEAYCCGVDIEVIEDIYAQKQSGIIENTKISDTEYGFFFFYQDILEVGGIRYQVKVACDEWSIRSFSCMEYRESDVRDTEEWEKGKKVLTEMLAQYQDEIAGKVYDMQYIYNFGMEIYNMKELASAYLDAYIINMERLSGMMEAVLNGKSYFDEMKEGDENTEGESYMFDISDAEDYSCQVIELNDVILLLIQGDYTMGIFYDPISLKFCGFSYFM